MKKALSFLLAAVLLLTLLPVGVLNVSAATSGTTGDCTWELNGTHLTIYGNGKMEDYSPGFQAPWGGAISAVTLENGVTTIGEDAFYGCDSLTAVDIPDSVTTIGEDAFYGCDSLTTVDIGDSVTTIGDTSFLGCYSLTTITVSNSNNWYSSVDGILFNKEKTALIRYPCGKIGTYIIPDSVTSIGNRAFSSCYGLTTVDIPDSVTTIGDRAFGGCLILKSITLPFIGQYADGSGATHLGYIFGAESYLENHRYVPTSLKHVIISDGSTIGDYAFYNCKSLTTVDIPDGVTSIGRSAFYGCDSLSTANIPDSVVSIGDWAYEGCSKLTSLILGNGVNTIGKYTFFECSNLGHVWYGGSRADTYDIAGLYNNPQLVEAIWHYNVLIENGHVYEEACDETCNLCGAIRKTADHVYDHACDTTCNICNTVRSITHDYANATCTKAKTCKVCGTTSGKKLGHTYSNDCDNSCNRCKATRTIKHNYKTVTKKATTTANGYTVKRCSVCKKETDKTTIYKASKISLSKTAYTYNGKVQKPSVTVKNSKGKTISSKYYTVTYASGRKNVGTYKVTVKFKGNYSGTKTLTFKINPPKTTVKSLTAGSKKLTASITKKSSQVTGYQIQYSTSKSFKTYKSKTVSSYKTTKATLTGLKAKKTYYVRVRTYKTVGGKKYYSGWSTIKYKKTK